MSLSLFSSSISVIVPAAGVGRRMKAKCPKQYLLLNGKTILEHTVETLLSHPMIHYVVMAVNQDDPYFEELSIASHQYVIRVDGGQERANSVLSGLNYIKEKQLSDWVLVHDAARPCLRHSDITKLIEHVVVPNNVGGILAFPVRDTMKRATDGRGIDAPIDRHFLWHALTPQLFKTELLYLALQKSLEKGVVVTDESSALEFMGHQPTLIHGRSDNIKITRPEDLALAEFYLSKMAEENR